jgi:glycogen debranching enzyme
MKRPATAPTSWTAQTATTRRCDPTGSLPYRCRTARYPPEQQKGVVDACARHLLTSHGLRSLDPRRPDSKGHHACGERSESSGDRRTRDAAYHQGTAWGWLIGPFVSAHLRVYRDPALARSVL